MYDATFDTAGNLNAPCVVAAAITRVIANLIVWPRGRKHGGERWMSDFKIRKERKHLRVTCRVSVSKRETVFEIREGASSHWRIRNPALGQVDTRFEMKTKL